ncbi:MAG: LacI family DNA-binding transcriptional regulator [Coriobacteriales bacterium]|nr:LacI family DNA-binding transcriptional regulator [Coriobacteriales bacterium]
MTNKEVAELAGVSSAAVSRFLNGGYLSEEKRERIAAAIEETGYVPSANARILRTKKSDTIGVILTKTDESAMSGVASGLEKYFFAGDYGTSLAYVGDDIKEQAKTMRSLLERQIDGIILVSSAPVPGDLELYQRARVPIVIIGQHVRNLSCVRFDNFGAAYDLASSLGCTPDSRIAYIDVEGTYRSFSTDRRRGFLAGLERMGVDTESVVISPTGFSVDDGYRSVSKLLSQNYEFDFISCATDSVAAGALKAIREHYGSLSSPRAPKVSGFGNDPILQAVAGPIPSVQFDYEECGIKAAEIMVDLLKDKSKGTASLVLGYQVVGI